MDLGLTATPNSNHNGCPNLELRTLAMAVVVSHSPDSKHRDGCKLILASHQKAQLVHDGGQHRVDNLDAVFCL